MSNGRHISWLWVCNDGYSLSINSMWQSQSISSRYYRCIFRQVTSKIKNRQQLYMDGVSLTQGSPRQHIWTFVSGLQENSGQQQSACPCNDDPHQTSWGMIIFVTREIRVMCTLPHQTLQFILMTHCGIGMVVCLRAPSCCTFNGSTSNFLT